MVCRMLLGQPGIATGSSAVWVWNPNHWTTREFPRPALFYIILVLSLNFIYFWPHCAARRILVPWPGIKPVPPAVEAQSPNHCSTREVHQPHFKCLIVSCGFCPPKHRSTTKCFYSQQLHLAQINSLVKCVFLFIEEIGSKCGYVHFHKI